MKLSAITFAALLSFTNAEFTINSFMTNVKAGQTTKITWQYDGTPAINGPVTLMLRWGDTNNLNPGIKIADVQAGDKSYDWAVPKEIDSRQDYTIMAVANGGNLARYNAQFTLQDGSGAQAPAPSSATPVSAAMKPTDSPKPSPTRPNNGNSTSASNRPLQPNVEPNGAEQMGAGVVGISLAAFLASWF